MQAESTHSRRDVLRKALATVGVAAPWAPARGAGKQPLDADTVATFRSKLTGEVVVPQDAAFDKARRVFFWNPATERTPAVIARCLSEDDIVRALEFADKHKLEVAVKGGGHSPMGWGTSNGLVIDLAQMNRVTVDPLRRTARVGAGALSGEVMRAAGAYELAPVLGQCPGVGAAGVTLGGGLGWLSGLYGAACDNLLSCRVVMADGRTLSVDADRNAELFWGMRGAGANFGVVSSFECRLHPVRLVTSGDIYYSLRDARTVVTFFRAFLADAPDSFQASLNLTRGERGVFISLCHAGSESEADRLLRALRTAATPAKENIRRLPFGDLSGRAPVAARDAEFRYIATVFRNEFSDELIDLTLDRLLAAPREAVLGITHYMHGELCRVSPGSTAFPLRTSGGVHIRFGLEWNDPAAAQPLMSWAEDARRLMRPAAGERVYANYQSHAGKQTAKSVFGTNLPRLVALKKKYDPANRLRRNSNIPPQLG